MPFPSPGNLGSPIARLGLFWRTFLLIAGLVIACLGLMIALIRHLDPAPAEQTLAWEIASVVNLTRTGLISAQPERRPQLLAQLAREESLRVEPLEAADEVKPLRPPARAQALQQRLLQLLGPGTRLASAVNGEVGLWVSFDIDGDPYWLGLDAQRFQRQLRLPWWAMLALAGGLGLLGALAVTAPLTEPLNRLRQAVGRISQGETPPPLPEKGPAEIAELNRRFNRMSNDLAQLENDRTLALAGISHDIRTPLTRLRMEVELSGIDDEEKRSMSDDIERIDDIVGKFIEYARSGGSDRSALRIETVDLDAALQGVLAARQPMIESGELCVAVRISPDLRWQGDPLDLSRMLSNLIENAIRYGKTDASGRTELSITAWREGDACLLEVGDRGPGIPAVERARLLRPFARRDAERSERGGSGLGLAIVHRLASRYQGDCVLDAGEDGIGLRVRLRLPDADQSR